MVICKEMYLVFKFVLLYLIILTRLVLFYVKIECTPSFFLLNHIPCVYMSICVYGAGRVEGGRD